MRKLTALLLFCLTACIEVEDLNGYWEKGILNSSLEGAWEQQKADGKEKGDIIDVTHGGEVHVVINRSEPNEIMKVKELVFDNGCTFFVERKEGDMATLMRFMQSEGTLITYTFSDDGALGKALAAAPLPGVELTGGESYQGIRIAKLDDTSVDSLKKLCALPVWSETARYTKVIPS